MADPQEIVAKLTKAQRKAVMKRGLGSRWQTTEGLQRRGLVTIRVCFPDGNGVSLTPLGLQVRKLLENSDD